MALRSDTKNGVVRPEATLRAAGFQMWMLKSAKHVLSMPPWVSALPGFRRKQCRLLCSLDEPSGPENGPAGFGWDFCRRQCYLSGGPRRAGITTRVVAFGSQQTLECFDQRIVLSKAPIRCARLAQLIYSVLCVSFPGPTSTRPWSRRSASRAAKGFALLFSKFAAHDSL